jgi:hypothetical protein
MKKFSKATKKSKGGDQLAKSDKVEPIVWVYSKRIRLRNGRVIYAHEYKLKAFRFPGTGREKNAT